MSQIEKTNDVHCESKSRWGSKMWVILQTACAALSLCSNAEAQSVNQGPDHWQSRMGIISMQYSAGLAYLPGAVQFMGDSLQEQRPPMLPNMPLANIPVNTSGPMQGYPAANYSMTFNCGLMGIGAHDFAVDGVTILAMTSPGKIIFSIGMNDAYQANNTSQFYAQFTVDVNAFVSAAVAKVGPLNVLVETNPIPQDAAHSPAVMRLINNILISMKSQYGVSIYDLAARQMSNGMSRPGFMSGDGVHLGTMGIFQRAFDEQSILTGQALGPQS